MDQRELQSLVNVMIARHGVGAEMLARKRASRCRRMLEERWVAIWTEVADRIAALARNAKPLADDDRATGA